jgi:hypothetical protein
MLFNQNQLNNVNQLNFDRQKIKLNNKIIKKKYKNESKNVVKIFTQAFSKYMND